MAQEEHPVPRVGVAVNEVGLPVSQKTTEQVKEELRAPIRRMPAVVAENLFMDPDFQRVMNWWMIRTHILWGISLAATFIGLNEGLIWIQQTWGVSNFAFFIIFMPLGVGYLLYQTLRFKKPKKTVSVNA